MQLPEDVVTFLKKLPLKSMKGDDILVAITFYFTGGKLKKEVELQDIKDSWSKSILGKAYNSAYLTRARGRVRVFGNGTLSLIEEGKSYVENLVGIIPEFSTALLIFDKGSSHSFDKFLREILTKATKTVNIADTYVTGDLFDTLLDRIPSGVPIKFIYGHDKGGFTSCAARFAKQYDFQSKESERFHDRFLIIDGKGFIVGPSLKDAADKKPATLVSLGSDDSKKLVGLFKNIWDN